MVMGRSFYERRQDKRGLGRGLQHDPNAMKQDAIASVTTSAITALVATWPEHVIDPMIGYAEKLLSVLILAMVAEVGRRMISAFWKKEK